jgi:hypothetical protein
MSWCTASMICRWVALHRTGVGRRSLGGGVKDRLSFGTDMSSSEELECSANMQQYGQEIQTAVGRFHARKFGIKSHAEVERKAALKVQAGGASKKQKTPVKDTVRAAFEELMQGEEEEKLNMARMERELASAASPLRSEPKNLTGTSDEARQKK